ncbi:unnamed protein product [Owenia fusiformis]|uniref:Uncharacterized protein n=1 Tax=Owenia fusiformis TaxID=6347 RepID=A0A8J1XLU2_OWEFU|nr:unnamed protein product [Owenia fusiformis]
MHSKTRSLHSIMNMIYILAFIGLALTISSQAGTLLKRGVHSESLVGYILESMMVDSLAKCSILCEANDECYSFNFELGSTSGLSQCDLVSCNADQNKPVLPSNAPLIYYGQVSGGAPLCDACLHVMCQNGTSCVETGPFRSNFTCLPIIDEDCGAIPTFTGPRDIQSTDGRVVRAYCDQGWTYIMKRFDGSQDFFRSWVEYQQGFGEPYNEHFIGLDNLASILKQRGYKVRFDLTTWPTVPTSQTGFAEYSVFNMADESDKYRLNISGYSGTAGDSMAYHNGKQFSTYDQDNNGNDCANTYKGAWWYRGCHRANLFGQYTNGENCPNYATCMTWRYWPDDIASPDNTYNTFKEVSMKIFRV